MSATKTGSPDTQARKIVPKPPPTITDLVILTFDPMRKVNNTLNEQELIAYLSELVVVSPLVTKILNFHNEVYNVGKLVGVEYIKQREKILLMREEISSLKKEIQEMKDVLS